MRVDARTHGRDVARILGIPLLETRLLLRKGRGILLEDIPRTQAEEIARLLNEQGVPCTAVASDSLPLLPPLRRAISVTPSPEALILRSGESADPESIAWNRIGVVSLGIVAMPGFAEIFSNIAIAPLTGLRTNDDPMVRDLMRENAILRIEQPQTASDTKTDPVSPDRSLFEGIEQKWGRKVKVYVDLLTVGLDAWIRIPMDVCGYVKSEGSVSLGGSWGFSLLIGDLVEHVPAAFTDIGRDLLSAADLRPLVFPQIEEFQRYTHWVAIRRHLKQ